MSHGEAIPGCFIAQVFFVLVACVRRGCMLPGGQAPAVQWGRGGRFMRKILAARGVDSRKKYGSATPATDPAREGFLGMVW